MPTPKQREANRLSQQRHRVKLRAFLRELKQAGCAKCNEKHPACLQFHHIDPTTKIDRISLLLTQTKSLPKLRLELEKCEILCANCHMKAHWEESNDPGHTESVQRTEAMAKTEIEYFEATISIHHEEADVERFKHSDAALAHITSVYEAHVAKARKKASTTTAAPGFRIEDDVLARNDPNSLFQRKVVWAQDCPDRPDHVVWHKDYFYVVRRVLTLRD